MKKNETLTEKMQSLQFSIYSKKNRKINRSHPEAVNKLHKIDTALDIPLSAHGMLHPSEHTNPGIALSLLGHFFVALEELAQHQRRGD